MPPLTRKNVLAHKTTDIAAAQRPLVPFVSEYDINHSRNE